MYILEKSHTEEKHVVPQKIFNAVCITNDLKPISSFHACPKNGLYINLKWAEMHLILRPTSESSRAWVSALIALKRLKTREVTIINVSHKWLGTLSLCLHLALSLFNWVSVMMVSVSGLSSSIFASVILTRPWREGFPCSAVPVSQWNIRS